MQSSIASVFYTPFSFHLGVGVCSEPLSIIYAPLKSFSIVKLGNDSISIEDATIQLSHSLCGVTTCNNRDVEEGYLLEAQKPGR